VRVRSTVFRKRTTRRGKYLGTVLMLACSLALGACASHHKGAGSSNHAKPAAVKGSSPGTPGSVATSSLPATANVASCQTSQLKIAMGPTGAVAGLFGGDVMFTNQGAATCLLNGWPTVVGVTGGGQTTAATPVHITRFGPVSPDMQAVTLSPGATAGFVFSADANGCSQSYATLRISPPGSTQYQQISAWLPYLKSYIPGCSPMNISPAVPQSALPNPAPPA